MPRLVAAIVVLLALLVPASAPAATQIGIGDETVAMFDDPLFTALHVRHARYFVPWNAASRPSQLARIETYVQRARRSGVDVLVHISTDDLRAWRAKLPSVAAYRTQVGRLIRVLRPLGVTEWGAWNEANHPSQPTWNRPDRAAAYFSALRGLCPGCTIVALDVLDQAGVAGYVDRFYAALKRSDLGAARLVGIHDYADVNRRSTAGTQTIIAATRAHVRNARFWLTETGAIVGLGRLWPCSTQRAADRTGYFFTLLRKVGPVLGRAYLYNFYGTDCRTRMDTGLVTAKGKARPAYGVVRHVLAHWR